jgi:hypothetical protein
MCTDAECNLHCTGLSIYNHTYIHVLQSMDLKLDKNDSRMCNKSYTKHICTVQLNRYHFISDILVDGAKATSEL